MNRTGHRLLYKSTLEHFGKGKIASGQCNVFVMQHPFLHSNHLLAQNNLQPLSYESVIGMKNSDFSKPFLFSYNTFSLLESQIAIKCENSTWSNGISLESPGKDIFVEAQDKKTFGSYSKLYQFGLSINLGKQQVNNYVVHVF